MDTGQPSSKMPDPCQLQLTDILNEVDVLRQKIQQQGDRINELETMIEQTRNQVLKEQVTEPAPILKFNNKTGLVDRIHK